MVSNLNQAGLSLMINETSPLHLSSMHTDVQWGNRTWKYVTTHKCRIIQTVGGMTAVGFGLAGTGAIFGGLLIEAVTMGGVSSRFIMIPGAVITVSMGCLFGSVLGCNRIYNQYLEWRETEELQTHPNAIN